MDQHVSSELDGRASRPAPPPPSRTQRLRPVLLAAGTAAALGAAGYFGYGYWTSGRFLVATDDAYVQADSVVISPEVAGYITQVAVQDNQAVAAGQVLARIDDRTYRAALASAQANAAAAAAGIDELQQQISQQKYVIAEAQAAVLGDQAALTYAQQNNHRYASLARSGAGTVAAAQQSVSSAQGEQANLARDQAAVGVAQTQMAVFGASLAKAQAELALQQAALQQAQLNLGYTVITAPAAGVVGERSLRVGQYVLPATQLMAVVPLQAVYIVANYKETQLTHVRPGQTVNIGVDGFPGAVVQGVVDSIAPASGAEFALLPPDNATGNFTKIVQRVPVKITIDPHDPLLGGLRPGMSVEPAINTKAGA